MPVLLQISQISKYYGPQMLLDDATVSFSDNQKIGMIGRNGVGKSTLCRIITEHESADEGEIIRNSALRLSYLEQHDDYLEGETVAQFLMRKSGAEEWLCGQTAIKFQITNDMLSVPFESLPGGFQTRVKLTSMLLGNPNFLLLDEPSNYLDLSTIILLENFLCDFKGGHLIVSHDREFLKRTCDHTLELDNGKLTLYPGDVEEYFEFKEEQLEKATAYNKGVQKKRDQLQAFADRFRAKASMASRAQSKLKQIQKLKTIEIAHEAGSVKIHIPRVEAKAGIGLTCEDLTIGYPDKDVASGISFDIEKGARVAILGDNGEGKTTFLKTIVEDLPVKAGKFKWGSNLKIGYYAQHVFSSLNPEDTVYGHLLSESEDGVTSQEVLNMAGCFLFKGDDVKKKVKVLSGGERSRLVLAGLLLSKSNVLLLDEPTNHLDFETVEALGHALHRFNGTVFFISHDRTFVNLIATNILEVKNGKIKRYPGTYEDYVYHLEMTARGEVEDGKPAGSGKTNKTSKNATSMSGEDDPAGKKKKGQKASETRKMRTRVQKAEKRVQNLTRERDSILEEMAKNPFFHSKERADNLKDLQVRIEEAEDEWLELQEKLERLSG